MLASLREEEFSDGQNFDYLFDLLSQTSLIFFWKERFALLFPWLPCDSSSVLNSVVVATICNNQLAHNKYSSEYLADYYDQ
jgi:hypothetical protein